MKLSQIELLRVLQETNFSLSQAAEKLNIVQSAVTRQLQLFEIEIGSPLFERKGKRLVAMTPLGLRIMVEVSAINQAKSNIQSLAADILIAIMVFYILPPRIHKRNIFYLNLFCVLEKNIPVCAFTWMRRHQSN